MRGSAGRGGRGGQGSGGRCPGRTTWAWIGAGRAPHRTAQVRGPGPASRAPGLKGPGAGPRLDGRPRAAPGLGRPPSAPGPGRLLRPRPPPLPTYQPLTSFWEFTSTPLSTSFCTSRMSPKAAASRSLSCCSFCSKRALIFPLRPKPPPAPPRARQRRRRRGPLPAMGRARGSPALLAPGPGLLLPPAAARSSPGCSRPATGPSLRPGRASRGPTAGDPIRSDNPDPDNFRSYPRPGRRAGCLCNRCTTLPAVIHGLFLDLPAPLLQGRRTDTGKGKKA